MADDDIIARAADGSEHRFPVNTDRAVIDRTMKSYATSLKNPATQTLDWTQVPQLAAKNLVPSAKRFGESIYQTVRHPIDTLQGIDRLVGGVASKLGVPGMKANEPYAEAAWQEIVKRYGGMEQLKHTIAEDPVGFVADVSTIVAPVEGLAAAPGKIGKIGEIAKLADPLRLPVTGAKLVAEVGGKVTGAGTGNIINAYRAGVEPSTRAPFRENFLRPEAHAEEIVSRARAAVAAAKAEKSAQYRAGMAQVGQNMTPLKFDKIDAAMAQASQIKKFQGQDIAKLAGQKKPLPAELVRADVQTAIDSWKRLDPATYHTAIGLDALKQAIGDIMDAQAFNSPERKVAETAYAAVRQTIIEGDKNYAKVMKKYETALAQVREFERTLSLRRGGTEDTALRKLLSAGRSGVNTNFGRRGELVEALNKHDPRLLPSLAGQSLSAYLPHGLMGAAVPAGALYHGGAAGLASLLTPQFIGSLLASSPALWGALAHATGIGVGTLKRMGPQQISQMITRGGKINPELLKAIATSVPMAARAAGAPSRLRVNVGTGEVTNAPQ